jgi:hypothetical protein
MPSDKKEIENDVFKQKKNDFSSKNEILVLVLVNDMLVRLALNA